MPYLKHILNCRFAALLAGALYLVSKNCDLIIPPEMIASLREYQHAVAAGMDPDELTALAFRAVKDDQFYIIPHPEINSIIQAQMEAVLQASNPRQLVELMKTFQ